MKQILSAILVMLLPATTALAEPVIPPELVGTHAGAMGQIGSVTKDGTLTFDEDRISLGGLAIGPGGDMSVAFVKKEGEVFERLLFTTVSEVVTGATVTWKQLIIEDLTYTAKLSRYGKVFRLVIKLYQDNQLVAGIQWVCADPAGADEPYPDVRVISKKNGWQKSVSNKNGKEDVTWIFQDDGNLMQASDLNGDGKIDYLRLQKPVDSFNHFVWIDTDHDGFFDQGTEGKLKMKIQVPDLLGFEDGNQ